MLAYIKELLKQNNLQQKEFASMIGVSPAAISQWEGIDKIRPEVLYKISRLFSISIDDLLEEKFKDEPIAKKCRRLYNLDGYEVDIMLKRKEVDALLEYSTRLKNIHERMWELLYLKALKTL